MKEWHWWVSVAVGFFVGLCVGKPFQHALLESLDVQIYINFVSIGVGGFITYLVAKYHYEKESRQLKEETEKLRHSNKIIQGLLETSKKRVIRDRETGLEAIEYIYVAEADAKALGGEAHVFFDEVD